MSTFCHGSCNDLINFSLILCIGPDFSIRFAVMVDSYDWRILRFVRFEDSTESSNRILKS